MRERKDTMSKFHVTTTFGLETSIEAEVSEYEFADSDVEDFEDNSYFETGDLTVDGGSISFKVEAEDEDDAERKAEDVVAEGNEVTDGNNLTWTIANVSHEIERLQMSLEEAAEFMQSWLDERRGMLPEYFVEALDVLLENVGN